MSGSVSPGLGILVKIFVVLAIFLGIAYLAVLLKLSLYDNRTLAWRIIFGTITPGLIALSLIISSLTDNKTINIVFVVLLAVVNLIYLLTPVNMYLTRLIYGGDKTMVSNILIAAISISTSLLILSGLLAVSYWVLKTLKI